MAWFGSNRSAARAPVPGQTPLTPTAGPGAVLGQGAPPPPSAAQAGSFATAEAIMAARRARKKATAKPTIVGSTSPHPAPAGSFVRHSLLGY